MIVAYQISGPDNGLSWYADASPQYFCSECDSVIDESYEPHVVRGFKSSDLSYTYDGKAIASKRFVGAAVNVDQEGVEFRPIGALPGFFEIMAIRVVAFDVVKRKTRFSSLCGKCGRFAETIGASPGFLVGVDGPLASGFYRSDIEFGTGRSKHPIIIVAPSTKRDMQSCGMKRIDYYPMYGGDVSLSELFQK